VAGGWPESAPFAPERTAKHNRSTAIPASLLPRFPAGALMPFAAMVRPKENADMGKKKQNVAEATTEAGITRNEAPVKAQAETATESELVPESLPLKKGRKKKGAATSGVTTLADLAAAYAVHMENEGKSGGTIASYSMELRVAQDVLGEGTLLADLTPERVGEFYTCKRVTKLRSGKNKSQLSIDKTRRVLRLALVWAADRGIISKAPLPEVDAK
jgi:hypothetical protein